MGDLLRPEAASAKDKKLDGYPVLPAFFDGEEAINSGSRSHSTYGQLPPRRTPSTKGNAGQTKAFTPVDMIGDKDLDMSSAKTIRPSGWLTWFEQAATCFHIEVAPPSRLSMSVEDDHLPFEL